MDKQERVKRANELIQVISKCGRRFFYSKKHDRTASVELDHRGRVWWALKGL